MTIALSRRKARYVLHRSINTLTKSPQIDAEVNQEPSSPLDIWEDHIKHDYSNDLYLILYLTRSRPRISLDAIMLMMFTSGLWHNHTRNITPR